MNLFDINAYLGNYPFRPVPRNTAKELLELMDREGIEQALVSPLEALFYRDAQLANDLLYKEIEQHTDRLLPAYVVNPVFPGWEDDLKRCNDDLGAKAIRLYPSYHSYKLDDSASMDVIDAASELNLLVTIGCRVEDPRKQHPLVRIPDADIIQIVSAAVKRPLVNFVTNGINGDETIRLTKLWACAMGNALPRGDQVFMGTGDDRVLEDGDFTKMNIFIEFSHTMLYNFDYLKRLLVGPGYQNLLLGTGMPFDNPKSALLKLDGMKISEDQKSAIGGKTARKILNIKD